MKRILCIWLTHWPIQRLLVAQPALRQQILILHDGQTPAGGSSGGGPSRGGKASVRGPLVKFCCRTAWERGVRVGMPLAEAVALLERPRRQVHVEPHDAQADLRALTELVGWCQRFSPVVGWQTTATRGGRRVAKARRGAAPATHPAGRGGEVAETDCLLLDVTAVGPLFGGERCLVEQVVEEFRGCGYTVRVAVADTIGTAWAVAHFEPVGQPGVSEQAVSEQAVRTSAISKAVLGRRGRPAAAAAWVVPPGADRAALGGLPIEALRLEPGQRQLLRQLGLVHVEQLLQLKRESLAARWGQSLLLRLDQALGATDELIDVPQTAPHFQARWQAEHPLEDRRLVEEVLWQLLQQVTAALAARDEGLVRLQCRLDCVDGQPLQLQIGLFRPTAEARHVVELVRLQLERLVLPGPVQQIQVEALATAPREHPQQQLFAEPARDGGLPVARLVDRLSSRLGSQSVLRPCLQADAQPERACRYEDRGQGTGARGQGTGARGQGTGVRGQGTGDRGRGDGGEGTGGTRLPGPRPLRLFCPALPLQVVAVAPDGPPIRIYWRQWWPVVQAWGPERIETGWWRGPAVRRDYYRIETQLGSRFWIYRQRNDGLWFLHGEFV